MSLVIGTTAQFLVQDADSRLQLAAVTSVAFIFASYLVWESEYERGNKAEARVQKRFDVHFDPDSNNCVKHTRFGENTPVVFFRLEVRPTNAVEKCSAAVVSVRDSTSKDILGERLALTWSLAEDAAKPYLADLESEIPRCVDVFYVIKEDGHFDQICIATGDRTLPHSVETLFAVHGPYEVTVVVAAPGCVSQTVRLAFEWHGDWNEVKPMRLWS